MNTDAPHLLNLNGEMQNQICRRPDKQIRLSEINPETIYKKRSPVGLNWSSLLMLIDIKNYGSQYNTITLDSMIGFSLHRKTTNMLIKNMWKNEWMDIDYLKYLSKVIGIKQNIPLVRSDMQLLPLQKKNPNAHNCTWILNHNIVNMLPLNMGQTEIFFEGFNFPVQIDVPFDYLIRQQSNIELQNRFQKLFCKTVVQAFGTPPPEKF